MGEQGLLAEDVHAGSQGRQAARQYQEQVSDSPVPESPRSVAWKCRLWPRLGRGKRVPPRDRGRGPAATFHELADGTAKVTILGNTVTMPEAAAAALRSASTAVPFPAGEFLPGADSRRALPAARQFLRLGALRIAN
jgi:hypothetical protein